MPCSTQCSTCILWLWDNIQVYTSIQSKLSNAAGGPQCLDDAVNTWNSSSFVVSGEEEETPSSIFAIHVTEPEEDTSSGM